MAKKKESLLGRALSAEKRKLEQPSRMLSNLWTADQERLYVRSNTAGRSELSPSSDPVQTPPSPRKPNVYQRIIAGERRIRGGSTR